jgi:hypothetical protein
MIQVTNDPDLPVDLAYPPAIHLAYGPAQPIHGQPTDHPYP